MRNAVYNSLRSGARMLLSIAEKEIHMLHMATSIIHIAAVTVGVIGGIRYWHKKGRSPEAGMTATLLLIAFALNELAALIPR